MELMSENDCQAILAELVASGVMKSIVFDDEAVWDVVNSGDAGTSMPATVGFLKKIEREVVPVTGRLTRSESSCLECGGKSCAKHRSSFSPDRR